MEYSSYYEPIAAPDYEADGREYYQPTPATVSVWAPEIQHGGPPAGLLMRAMLRCAPDPGLAPVEATRDFNKLLTRLGIEHEYLDLEVDSGQERCELDFSPVLQFMSDNLVFDE